MDKKETAEWATCRPGLCHIYIGIFLCPPKFYKQQPQQGRWLNHDRKFRCCICIYYSAPATHRSATAAPWCCGGRTAARTPAPAPAPCRPAWRTPPCSERSTANNKHSHQIFSSLSLVENTRYIRYEKFWCPPGGAGPMFWRGGTRHTCAAAGWGHAPCPDTWPRPRGDTRPGSTAAPSCASAGRSAWTCLHKYRLENVSKCQYIGRWTLSTNTRLCGEPCQ